MKKIWTDKKEYEKEYKAIEKTLPDFLEELKDFAGDFLETNFKIEDTIPIIFNGRLTRCGGRFSFNKIEAKNIEISKKNTIHSIMMNKKSEIFDALKHELIHYALYTLEEPFYDGDEEFERALAKYDAPSSSTTPKHLRFTNKMLHSYDLLKIYTDPNDKVVAVERKGKSYYSNVVIKNRNTGRKVYEGEIFHKGYELHTF